MPNGPFNIAEVRGETITIVFSADITVPTLVGAVLQFRIWDQSFVLVQAAYTIGIGITVNTTVTPHTATVVIGPSVPAGFFRWELFRTNAGIETQLAFGTLQFEDRP